MRHRCWIAPYSNLPTCRWAETNMISNHYDVSFVLLKMIVHILMVYGKMQSEWFQVDSDFNPSILLDTLSKHAHKPYPAEGICKGVQKGESDFLSLSYKKFWRYNNSPPYVMARWPPQQIPPLNFLGIRTCTKEMHCHTQTWWLN